MIKIFSDFATAAAGRYAGSEWHAVKKGVVEDESVSFSVAFPPRCLYLMLRNLGS